jgi:hypothetical protein
MQTMTSHHDALAGSASVHCIACRWEAALHDESTLTCLCERSRASLYDGEIELVGPCVAWWNGTPRGRIGHKRLDPML